MFVVPPSKAEGFRTGTSFRLKPLLRNVYQYQGDYYEYSAPAARRWRNNQQVKWISILVADDHTLVRAGIRALVEKLPYAKVIAEAKDGREALRLVREHKPDVVLMDVAMPGLNGLEATSRIRQEFPEVSVIVLSMYANEEYVRGAIHAGASGYLPKRGAATELEEAIKAGGRGELYFSPLVSRYIVRDRKGQVRAGRALIERLTPRQREILQLIAERHNNSEIAGVLEISIKTVETHRAQLMARLGIYDVPGLVRFAIRAGLVSLE
jgi:DNA-binding NarL/FixJ family response regulator